MGAKEIIEKKKNKEILKYEEIEYMVNSYVKEKISDKTMSEFIMLIYNDGLSLTETYYLTDVMIKSGDVIDLSKAKKPCVDKHSTGGVGDKVTLIVSAICASAGVCVPKMSGRGLGLTGGTVDKLESITGYRLKLSKKEFIDALNKVGCAVISQSEKIAVADKKIYALRDITGTVANKSLIASSIMNTMAQAIIDTINRLAPFQARNTAKTNATAPATGELVASIMAGNVMAASVIYGT